MSLRAARQPAERRRQRLLLPKVRPLRRHLLAPSDVNLSVPGVISDLLLGGAWSDYEFTTGRCLGLGREPQSTGMEAVWGVGEMGSRVDEVACWVCSDATEDSRFFLMKCFFL
jgi:hypothetical protein